MKRTNCCLRTATVDSGQWKVDSCGIPFGDKIENNHIRNAVFQLELRHFRNYNFLIVPKGLLNCPLSTVHCQLLQETICQFALDSRLPDLLIKRQYRGQRPAGTGEDKLLRPGILPLPPDSMVKPPYPHSYTYNIPNFPACQP